MSETVFIMVFFVSWNFILNYLRERHETQHPNILGHLGRLDCLFLVATRAYGFSCNSLLRLNWILLWCGFCTNLLYHHIYVCRYKCNFQLQTNIYKRSLACSPYTVFQCFQEMIIVCSDVILPGYCQENVMSGRQTEWLGVTSNLKFPFSSV